MRGLDFVVDSVEKGVQVLTGHLGPAIGILFSAVGASVWTVDKVKDMVTYTVGLLAAVAVPTQALPDIVGFCSLANYVLPLTEIVAMFAMLSTLYVAAIVYRFAKSWIPTLS